MMHDTHGDCPHCRARGTVRAPGLRWRVARALAWIYVVATVFLLSLLGPWLTFIAPLFLFQAAFLLAEVHRRADAPPTCTACGKIALGEYAPARAVPVGLRPAESRA